MSGLKQFDLFKSTEVAKVNGHASSSAPKPKRNGHANASSAVGIGTLRDMLEIWNAEMGDISTARALGKSRATHMRKRLLDTFAGDLDQWRCYCRRIRMTPFCCGESERGWVCDLNAACQEQTCLRILEGYYEHRRRAPNGLAATLRALRG